MQRKYTLTVPGGNSATVRLHYRDSDLVGAPTETDLVLFRYDTTISKWVKVVSDTRNTAGMDDNYVEKTGVATFSDWVNSIQATPTAMRLNDLSTHMEGAVNWIASGVAGMIELVLVVGLRWSRK